MAYTNIDDPSAYFQIATYTGNGTDNTAITNDGNSDLQPDWIWIKRTSSSEDHQLADSTRGVTKWLQSNLTNSEGTTTARLKSFDTDGFTLGDTGSTNNSGDTFVAWQWKANGGTTSSNTDGATTSTVQANTDAGFSIVTWTGTGSATTLGHGLSDTPKMLIVKNRSTTVDWAVYHKGLTNPGYVLTLNTSDGELNSGFQRWNRTHPTSSVFSVGTGQQTNENTSNMIAYCFAEKQGYSKFGSYIGNGANDGPFVYTGFKPAFLLFKRVDNSRSWVIIDTKRDPHNVASKRLFPDGTSANNVLANLVDLVSNGFKVRHLNVIINSSNEKYIYMAFAENPFVTSTGTPTTAR